MIATSFLYVPPQMTSRLLPPLVCFHAHRRTHMHAVKKLQSITLATLPNQEMRTFPKRTFCIPHTVQTKATRKTMGMPMMALRRVPTIKKEVFSPRAELECKSIEWGVKCEFSHSHHCSLRLFVNGDYRYPRLL